MANNDVQYLIDMLYEMIDGAKGVLMAPDKCIIVREEALDLLEKRQAARKAKDYKTADALRDELRGMGYAIEDTPQGPKLRAL